MHAMVLKFPQASPATADAAAAKAHRDKAWTVLIIQAQAGDKAAYGQLLQDLLPWLQQQARHLVSPAQADDVVQEALLGLHRVLHTYDAARPLTPWLYGILRFKAKESWRQAMRHQHDELMEETELAIDGVLSEQLGARHDALKLLARLSPQQAQVLQLTQIKGLSAKEAAQVTGQTVAWVKVNVHRALKKLALMVKANEH